HGSNLWTRIAASNPEIVEVTGYPLDDGTRILVFDWEVGTRPVHEIPRVGISATPPGVTLFVRE
ncbi:MAG TPA: hypothetical protein VHL54_09570, partial [Actinomycetota bacterium]|nr:hypothetical protein [Actinomycetota bacterium]